jgi:hypothetical protein
VSDEGSHGGAPTRGYGDDDEEEAGERAYAAATRKQQQQQGDDDERQYHGIGEAHGGESVVGMDDEEGADNVHVRVTSDNASSIYDLDRDDDDDDDDDGNNPDSVDALRRLPMDMRYSHVHGFAGAAFGNEHYPLDGGAAEDEAEGEEEVYDVDGDDDDAASFDGDDDAAYDSDGGESLYHDTVQAHVSHEDREDAFDYENFFLHSAMGSFTQERLAGRSRSSTVGSDASIATARATTALERRPLDPKRVSVASFATTASFATADDGSSVDGRYEDDNDDDEFERRDRYDETDYDVPSGRLSKPALLARPVTVAQTSHHRPTISVDAPGLSRPYSAAVIRPGADINGVVAASRHHHHHHRKTALSVGDAGRAVTNGGGILTPRGSPDPLRQLSDSLLSETESSASISAAGETRISTTATGSATGDMRELLARDDQLLVQRLVGSLGKCILALGEAGRASAEGRAQRRRLDRALRVLEGVEAGL